MSINPKMMMAASFGMDNNKLAVFDLNKTENQVQADIFHYTSPLQRDSLNIPFLKSGVKIQYQNSKNANYNYQDIFEYTQMKQVSKEEEILKFYNDSLNQNRNQKPTYYTNLYTGVCENQNERFIHQFVGLQNTIRNSKLDHNVFIAGGSDFNLRYISCQASTSLDDEEDHSKNMLISNFDGLVRCYNKSYIGNVYIQHEYYDKKKNYQEDKIALMKYECYKGMKSQLS